MARRADPGSQLAAWQVVALAGVGIVIGLWYVGALDRPVARVSDVMREFDAGHAGAPDERTVGALPPVSLLEPVVAVDGPETVARAQRPGPTDRPEDPDEEAESAARLQAVIAEQAAGP
jgi:hypothetical protein